MKYLWKIYDISYVNIENDLEDYNKFEYTNLYYTQFINSILDIIQKYLIIKKKYK